MITLVLAVSIEAQAQFNDTADDDDDDSLLAGIGFMAIGIIMLIVNIAILVWIYKDAEARGKSGIGWLIFALICGPLACIIGLLTRPDLV